MDDQALRIAVAIAPYLRLRIFSTDERIVGRYAAILAQAKNLAGIIVELLRPVLMMALAEGKKQIAVEKNHASAVMEAIFRVCVCCEEALAVDHLVVAQAEAIDHGCAAFARPGGITQVDPSIFRVVRMQRDVMESGVLTSQGR